LERQIPGTKWIDLPVETLLTTGMADTSPKPFVFVLMPFAEAFQDVYEVGIKPACSEAGAYCERVDEQIFQKETILTRIYNQIAKADIIVADMTGRNPNVFYEVGYAHALGKQVVLLTQNSDDIPFDLKHYSHIVYSGKIVLLKEELTKRVRWIVEHPERRLEQVDQRLQLYLDGSSLENSPEILGDTSVLDKTLDVHNPSSKTFAQGSIKIGIIARSAFEEFGAGTIEKVITIPNLKKLFMLRDLDSLFPLAWESLRITICVQGRMGLQQQEHFVVRVFTEFGAYDYPFTMSSKPKSSY
jgi:hypothetical protein